MKRPAKKAAKKAQKKIAKKAAPPAEAKPQLGTINTPRLAALFGLTAVRIGQLQKDGVLSKIGVGEFDLWKSVSGYISLLQKKRNGGGSDITALGMEESKLKKIQAEAAILEHKLSIQKGEYVSSESQLAEGMKLGLVIRGIFQRVEPDLTPRLAGRTAAECSDILREYMHAKLVELSEYESSIAIAAD